MGPDCRAEGRIIDLKETAFGSRVCRKTKASIMGKGDEWRQTGKQGGAVTLMSQQLCALLSCQYGPRLEHSLHSHSSSSWQHQEKKVRHVRNEFV